MFLRIVLSSKRKVFANFKTIILRSLWFYENENFASHATRELPILPFFGIEPNRQKFVSFQKS